VLDLALTNQPALVTGFEILDNSILQSDHRPILTKMINYSHQQKLNAQLFSTCHPRWRSEQASPADWDKFSISLADQLTSWFTEFSQLSNPLLLANPSLLQSSQSLIEQAWSSLSELIRSTARNIIGQTKGRRPPVSRQCYLTNADEIRSRSNQLRQAQQISERSHRRLLAARSYAEPNDSAIEQLSSETQLHFSNLRQLRSEFNQFLKDIGKQEYANFLRTIVDPENPDPTLDW
jgi:hypothetical protein